jgi:hypothetical protein
MHVSAPGALGIEPEDGHVRPDVAGFDGCGEIPAVDDSCPEVDGGPEPITVVVQPDFLK